MRIPSEATTTSLFALLTEGIAAANPENAAAPKMDRPAEVAAIGYLNDHMKRVLCFNTQLRKELEELLEEADTLSEELIDVDGLESLRSVAKWVMAQTQSTEERVAKAERLKTVADLAETKSALVKLTHHLFRLEVECHFADELDGGHGAVCIYSDWSVARLHTHSPFEDFELNEHELGELGEVLGRIFSGAGNRRRHVH